ncbi:MAG: ASKHA domain-containing protein [Actinomycetota bacterium]|nr:ASKHA domain-containing protein [Actinomycetota bacterium]
MPKILFYPDNRVVEVEKGESLIRAAMLAGVHINASCGGSSTCGKCRVIIENGKVNARPSAKLSADEVSQGYVLACTTTVDEDIEVRIPIESQMGDSRVALERELETVTHGGFLSAKSLVDLIGEFNINPATQRLYVELPPPNLEDNVSDLERLRRELNRQHGISNFQVDISVLRGMGALLREADWKITATILSLGGSECDRLIRIDKGDRTDKHYGLAVDIGTTSIYVELVDLSSGETLAKASEYNAQVSCGEDIISRIVYSLKENGLAKLQELVTETINKLIDRVIEKSGVELDDIVHMVAAGNTTMTHIFLGVPPKYIREEPYIPTATFMPTVMASDVGLKLPQGTRVYTVPSRASYVGGDITAGLLGSGVYRSEKLTLYIDVGTNGEMVLGNSDWLLSCSCSAGPAFEGGSIKNGMRATKGAIEQVRINPKTLEPMILTIGQARPRGICGSGLIDTVAELFLTGVINEKGRFNTEIDHPRIREVDGQAEYVLVWAADSATKRDIVITEADLDNLIRTKGAIYAGITTLLDSMQMQVEAIEEVLIAGGFGRYLQIDQAMTIGLLPEIDPGKVKYVGNGSLLGSRLILLSKEAKDVATEIAQKMTYLELSTHAGFMDSYVSALFLPHTDRDTFPTVMKRMKVY